MADPRSPASPDKDYWGWLKRTNPVLFDKLIKTRRHPPEDYRSAEFYKQFPSRRPPP